MSEVTDLDAPDFTAGELRHRCAGSLLSAPGPMPALPDRSARRTGPSDFDLNPDMPQGTGAALKPAAVLVAIRDLGVCASIILTRRAHGLSAHAGQIAFPGGRVDPTDVDPQHTALREAHEEIGLNPGQVSVLGYLDAYRTGTGFFIWPVVGIVTGAFTPRPEPGEVDQVFEVPLDFAMDPANLYIHATMWGGAKRSTYALAFENHKIWGATAAMLKNLYDRVYRQ